MERVAESSDSAAVFFLNCQVAFKTISLRSMLKKLA